MASKKVKKSSQKSSTKKTQGGTSKKSKKSKKPKKQIRKASQDPVRPIPPIPSLSEEDLQEMEEARSQFNGSVGDQPSRKQQNLAKKEKSRKEALSATAETLFDKHKTFCDKISGLANDINSLVSQASELDGSMKHSELRSYNINRRLNFDSLVKDLRVASTRLGKISASSGTLNKVHRDLVYEDIHAKKPAFE